MPIVNESLSDAAILSQALTWLSATPHQEVMLITVVATFGSSPAPPGSIMVFNGKDRIAGSISGGCIEQDLLPKLRRLNFQSSTHFFFEYGIDTAQAQRTGLTCGGQLKLLAESLRTPAQVIPLLDAINNRTLIQRRLCLRTGEVSLHRATHPGVDLQLTGDVCARYYGPRWRLVLIGTNHLAYGLAAMAHTLDFEILICDPRSILTPPPRSFPLLLLAGEPEEAVRDYAQDQRCAVIALSHNPNLDDAALAEALQGPAFYVGALGSKHSAQKRIQRLLALGVAPERISSLHAPVGLDIGSRQPQEIAIAIAAQLIAQRNRMRASPTTEPSLPSTAHA